MNKKIQQKKSQAEVCGDKMMPNAEKTQTGHNIFLTYQEMDFQKERTQLLGRNI